MWNNLHCTQCFEVPVINSLSLSLTLQLLFPVLLQLPHFHQMMWLYLLKLCLVIDGNTTYLQFAGRSFLFSIFKCVSVDFRPDAPNYRKIRYPENAKPPRILDKRSHTCIWSLHGWIIRMYFDLKNLERIWLQFVTGVDTEGYLAVLFFGSWWYNIHPA